MSLCTALQTSQVQSEKEQGSATDNEKMESKCANLGRLPIELVIGPYIPVQEPLHPAGLLVYVTFCWKCLQELDQVRLFLLGKTQAHARVVVPDNLLQSRETGVMVEAALGMGPV